MIPYCILIVLWRDDRPEEKEHIGHQSFIIRHFRKHNMQSKFGGLF